MKKIIILLVAITMFSCNIKKIVTSKEERLSGNWYLDKITYSSDGDYSVTLFEDASKYCFVGSTWKFLKDNNTGTYVINKNSCATQIRNFNYKIGSRGDAKGFYNFTLTPENGNTTKTYNLLLKDLDMRSMEWQEYRTIDGVKFTINMRFTKFE